LAPRNPAWKSEANRFLYRLRPRDLPSVPDSALRPVCGPHCRLLPDVQPCAPDCRTGAPGCAGECIGADSRGLCSLAELAARRNRARLAEPLLFLCARRTSPVACAAVCGTEPRPRRPRRARGRVAVVERRCAPPGLGCQRLARSFGWRRAWDCASWLAELAAGTDDTNVLARLREATRTGRPVGGPEFITDLESRLDRPLRPGKRGPKVRRRWTRISWNWAFGSLSPNCGRPGWTRTSDPLLRSAWISGEYPSTLLFKIQQLAKFSGNPAVGP